MNQLTNLELIKIKDSINSKSFKSRYIEWEDLEWDRCDNNLPIAKYNKEEFEFGNNLFLIRVDLEVSFEFGKVEFNLSNIKEVWYKEEEVSITTKQEGFLLFKIHQHLTDNF